MKKKPENPPSEPSTPKWKVELYDALLPIINERLLLQDEKLAHLEERLEKEHRSLINKTIKEGSFWAHIQVSVVIVTIMAATTTLCAFIFNWYVDFKIGEIKHSISTELKHQPPPQKVVQPLVTQPKDLKQKQSSKTK